VRAGLFALLLTASVPGILRSQGPEVSEARAKVILIEKLVRFVEWPGEPPSAHQPFVLGVVGRTPFGDELDEHFRRRTLKNRPVRIRYFKGPQDVEDCDLIFVCASEKDHIGTLLSRLQQRPVLTLGETPGFTKAGVMVGIIREGERIGFELNLTRAKECGFRFAQGFMQLAKVQG
jgi:hypothetical protein